MIDIKIIASGSSGNCYRISDGKTALLLDAGIPIKQIQKALDFRLGDIRGCFITHQHSDHCKGADDLYTRGISLYGNTDLALALDDLTKVKRLEALHPVGVDTWTVTPFDVYHDVPCFAFKLQSLVTGESLLYMTDAGECRYAISDIDYMIVEANHSRELIDRSEAAGIITTMLANRIRATHMSIDTLCEYLETGRFDSSRLKGIYLVHLSDNNSNAEDFRNRVQDIVPHAEVVVI